jgi:hypothetical protein
MKDEVQSPQEETPNTYWRWLVESWRYPFRPQSCREVVWSCYLIR